MRKKEVITNVLWQGSVFVFPGLRYIYLSLLPLNEMRYISVYPSFKSGFRDSLLVSMYTPTWRERERGGGMGGANCLALWLGQGSTRDLTIQILITHHLKRECVTVQKPTFRRHRALGDIVYICFISKFFSAQWCFVRKQRNVTVP